MKNKIPSTVLFVHDHKFIKDDAGDYYSEGKITDKVLMRYLILGDKLKIISRVQDGEGFDLEKLSKINSHLFAFNPVAGNSFGVILGRKLFKNTLMMAGLIRKARTVVIRMPCFLSLIAFPLILLYGKKYFLEVVGFPREAAKGKGSGVMYGLIGHFMHIFMRLVVRNASGVVYVSKKALQEKFPSGRLVAGIPNVELTLFPEVNRNYEITGLCPKIGLIGSFSANYKGIDTAIKVISRLRAEGIDCNLHILGAGDQSPYLRLAHQLSCSHAVHFDGVRVGGRDVAEWLDGLDLYIQPSRTEGMPRALIEAMSRGLPIVASNVGSIPEVIDLKYLCEPEDVDDFYVKIKDFVLSKNLRAMNGKFNAQASKEFAAVTLDRQREQFWNSANRILEG